MNARKMLEREKGVWPFSNRKFRRGFDYEISIENDALAARLSEIIKVVVVRLR